MPSYNEKRLERTVISIQPKIPEMSVRNQMERTVSFGPTGIFGNTFADRSGLFGRSDRNFPFHLTKLLSLVPLGRYPYPLPLPPPVEDILSSYL